MAKNSYFRLDIYIDFNKYVDGIFAICLSMLRDIRSRLLNFALYRIKRFTARPSNYCHSLSAALIYDIRYYFIKYCLTVRICNDIYAFS